MSKRKRGSRLTITARRQLVEKLRRESRLTVKQIAGRAGVSETTVGYDLKALGLSRSAVVPAPKQRIQRRAQEAVTLRRKGLSLRRVAKRLGVSHETVSSDLAKMGYSTVPVRPDVEARRAEVARLRADGKSRKEIADTLGIRLALLDRDIARIMDSAAAKEAFKARAQASVANLPDNLWDSLELEAIGRLRTAAREGSVAASATLLRIANEQREVSASRRCADHVPRDEVDRILLGCVEVIRDRVTGFVKSLGDEELFDDFDGLWARTMETLDAQYPAEESEVAAA